MLEQQALNTSIQQPFEQRPLFDTVELERLKSVN
jgi:hypothetical protein